MAYGDIPHDICVKSTKEVLIVNPDIDEIAENYGEFSQTHLFLLILHDLEKL